MDASTIREVLGKAGPGDEPTGRADCRICGDPACDRWSECFDEIGQLPNARRLPYDEPGLDLPPMQRRRRTEPLVSWADKDETWRRFRFLAERTVDLRQFDDAGFRLRFRHGCEVGVADGTTLDDAVEQAMQIAGVL